MTPSPASHAPSADRPWPIKAAAVLAVAGLHLGVLATMLYQPVSRSQGDMPEMVEIRFVELAPEIVDTTPAPEQTIVPEPEPEITPEPEPIPEPEPEPEPIPEPEPEPEPIPEPEPETIVLPEPPPPPPKPRPRPRPRPVPTPPVRVVPAAPAPPSGQATQAAIPQAPAPAPDPGRPRVIGQVSYLNGKPKLDYPRASLRRGEQGRVVLRVLISPKGTADKVTVQSSSGHRLLDEAAIKAVRRTRFKPYTEDGVAYPAQADIPFNFSL